MNANLFRPLFRRAALVVAAVAAMAAMPALAESPALDTEIDRAVSTKSRADLRAELEQARRDGSMAMFSEGHSPLLGTTARKTRADVRAEVIHSRDFIAMGAGEAGFAAVAKPQHQGAPLRVAQR